MSERYFAVGQLAGLPGMPSTKRRVRARALRERWPWRERNGRGGGREYPLSALPEATQLALAQRMLQECAPQTDEAPPALNPAQALTLGERYERGTYKQKERAQRKLAAVLAYHDLVEGGTLHPVALASAARQAQVSDDSLRRWLQAVEGAAREQWLYLLFGAHAGGAREVEIPTVAWQMLVADYLRPERPSIASCLRRLERAAQKEGWELPHPRTIERRLQALPRAVRVLARHGRKAAAQMYPAQQRDKRALTALQILNGDGYKHNLWVRFPDGEIVRAKTWVWQDVYSNRVLAWRVDKSEHTDVIRLSFGDVVERYGLPEAIVVDNTMAAANKVMTGGTRTRFRFKVKPEEPLGVFPLLGVQVHWATPGHGQAKPVERVFGVGGVGEYIDRAPDFAGAWTGASTLDKPEYDGKTRAVELSDLERVIEREIAAWNAQPGRRSAVAQGRSYDEVFRASYESAPIRRATDAQRRLWLLATEPVRASARDGAITLDAGRAPGMANRYWCAALTDYAGELLVARFDPAQLHRGVHVYTVDGRYLAFADCHAPAGFNDQAAARNHNRARRQFVRAQREMLEAQRRMDVSDVARMVSEAAPQAHVTTLQPRVIRPLRDPMERPAPKPNLTPEQQAEISRFRDEAPIPLRRKLGPGEEARANFEAWLAIDQRKANAEQLSAEDLQLWESYQKTWEYQSQLDMWREREEWRAKYG